MRVRASLFVLMLSGCASMYTPTPEAWRNATSGVTGCAPASIVVSETTVGGGHRTWKAECSGKTYRCSSEVNYMLIENPRCTLAATP